MLAKPLMFLSSYAPLFAILAIRVQTMSIRLACVALAVAGVLALLLILNLDRRTTRAEATLMEVRNAGAEASSYLAGYLLPFLVVADPTMSDVLAYTLFLIVVGVVTIRTGVIQVNPLLFVVGYSVYHVTDSTNTRYYLLSRRRLTVGTTVLTTSLSDDVRVCRPARTLSHG